MGAFHRFHSVPLVSFRLWDRCLEMPLGLNLIHCCCGSYAGRDPEPRKYVVLTGRRAGTGPLVLEFLFFLFFGRFFLCVCYATLD